MNLLVFETILYIFNIVTYLFRLDKKFLPNHDQTTQIQQSKPSVF